jgi:hypothetical protein
MTAFQQVHAVEQATLVLFETALLPAAARLWQAPIESFRGKIHWRESTLVSEGRRPLGLPELSRAIYDTDLPAAAMTHAVHQARWIEADFQVTTGCRRCRWMGASNAFAAGGGVDGLFDGLFDAAG